MIAKNDAVSRTRMSPSECRACADMCATLADLAKTEDECRGFDALSTLWESLAQDAAAMSTNDWLALLAATTDLDRAIEEAYRQQQTLFRTYPRHGQEAERDCRLLEREDVAA